MLTGDAERDLKASMHSFVGFCTSDAVRYQLLHALAMLVLARLRPFPAGAWWCFAMGILVFSGSLFVLALTGLKWLGAVTPIGGVAFLAGWLWLVIRAPRD